MKKCVSLFFVCMLIPLAGCRTVQAGESRLSGTDGEPPPAAPAPNPSLVTRLLITREAASYMRYPYSSPPNVPSAFDCSSFISHIYAQFGYTLPRSTAAFGNVGTRIPWEDAQAGDILVFAREKGSSNIDHVAMLWKKSDSGELAGSWLIHAASINTGTSMQRGNPDTRTGVVITQLGLRGDGVIENEYFYQRFMFCTRVLDE